MLEAALFQLRNGAADPSLDVFFTVLENAIAGARDSVNAARISDIDFALNDLAAAIDELPASDFERLAGPLKMMRDDVERLKAETSLSPELVGRIRGLQ